MTHPDGCTCRTCRIRATLHRAPKTEAEGPLPTAAELERHAKKYGPGGVAETAAELGLHVKVERPKRARRRGPTLRQRVRALLEDGHSVDTIAEMENLTPGRARRLVEELS